MTAVAASSGFPARARAGHLAASSEGLTFLMDSPSFFVFNGFTFHCAYSCAATLDLLTPSMRRRLRQSSPRLPHRLPLRLWLIGSVYQTFGRSRVSPVMLQDHCLQAAAGITPMVHSRRSARPIVGRDIWDLVSASCQGRCLAHHQGRNAVSQSHLAWPLRHAAFSGPSGGDTLAAYLR